MANITTENINTLAQLASSIGDGDYIYVYKSGAGCFSRIEKSAFLAGVGNNSGGMSAEVYAAIQANVETLREAYNQLVSDLANLAFTNTPKTSTVAAFSWPDNDSGSGDTPTGDPSLTVYVDGVAVSNGSTINIGTNTGSGVSKAITIKGSNLTRPVSLTMGASTSGLSVTPTSLSASQTMATSGATATISYSGTIASASGSLTISSGAASVIVNLTASYQEQGVGEFTISPVLTDLYITPENGWTVESGGYWNGTIRLASGVTGKQIPQALIDIQIIGTHGDVNYDANSGWLSIDNITSNITIVAQAESITGDGYAVTNRLLNMTSNGAASTDGTSDYTATVDPVNGAVSNNDLRVYIGDTRYTGFTFNNNVLTIPASAITGDIVIEATAHTGTVKVKASEAATININGTSHTLSGSGEWETISTSMSNITTLSAASSDRTKFTAFDFGGAVASGFFSASAGFVGMSNVTEISGLVIKTTSASSSMVSAFHGCLKLETLQMIGWEMEATTTFASCFRQCNKITTMDISKWVTSNCTSLSNMFYSCSGLTSVNLNGCDVRNVTTINSMFNACGALSVVDIRDWETSNLTNLNTFLGAGDNAKTLIIGKFDTSKVSSVTTTGYFANTCTIYCTQETPPAMGAGDWLGRIYTLRAIYVPNSSSEDAYKRASGWNTYSEKISVGTYNG